MAKMTVEQAVAAIHAADTNSAIWTVLMQCTKYDMVDVYAYVTGQDHKFNMRQKKEHLASAVVSMIMDWRKDAEFKAKSLAEKIEFVKACTPYKAGSYLCKCTDDEVLAIASELGVPERYAQKANSKYFVIDDIVHALRAMVTEQRISELLAMDDKIGVKEELKDASTMTLNLLVKMAGLDIDCEASDVSRKVKEEALYKYYTEKAQEVPAAVEAQSAVTYSDVDDAYFAFEAESKRCCTAGEDADFTLCNKLEREYLRLLADYHQTDMPEGQEVLKFIRENYHDDCELARKSSWELNEMAMKCGINGHSYSHSRELVKDLARTANIPVLSDWTSLTIYQKRKQLQECLHYTWQLRHGMKKLKKLHQAGTISNEDYQAICFVCDLKLRTAKNAPFFEYYKEVCRVYAEVNKRKMINAG